MRFEQCGILKRFYQNYLVLNYLSRLPRNIFEIILVNRSFWQTPLPAEMNFIEDFYSPR